MRRKTCSPVAASPGSGASNAMPLSSVTASDSKDWAMSDALGSHRRNLGTVDSVVNTPPNTMKMTTAAARARFSHDDTGRRHEW